MTDLAGAVDEVAREIDFSGVVRIERDGAVELDVAYGWAHRGWRIPNTPTTRFALASGNKGFTALAVMSLVDEGTLSLATTARSILGEDLPLIDDRVTVEHLLGHRSGIGDYLDEEAGNGIDDYVMGAVHELVMTEDFLPRLDGYPMSFPPDDRFAYNNGGYMVLALLAERASGVPVPRPGGGAGLRAGRDARDRVPPLGRAARWRRPRLPRHGGRLADQRLPPPRPWQRGRWRLLDDRPTCPRSGPLSSRGGS